MNFGGKVPFNEEDVVARIKVHFAPDSINAHVFQFSTRLLERPLERQSVKFYSAYSVGNKHDNTVPSTDLINDKSRLTMVSFFDKFGSRSFANSPDYLPDPEEGNVYKYTQTSQPFHSRSNYLVGHLRGQSLFLSPVRSVHSFSPHLTHKQNARNSNFNMLMQQQQQQRRVDGPTRLESIFCSECPFEGESSVPERTKLDMERQRSTMLNKEADNAVELRYFTRSSIESKAFKQRYQSLCSALALADDARVRDRSHTSEISCSDDLFFPPAIVSSGGITGGEENQHSVIRSFASRHSLTEIVSDLMHRCQILPYSVVLDVVGDVAAGKVLGNLTLETAILRELTSTAIYIHGVWVCRNNRAFSGVGAALREWVIASFFFSENGALFRKELNTVTTSSSHRRLIKEILQTIAVLGGNDVAGERSWSLRYMESDPEKRRATVEDFLKHHGADIAHDTWKNKLKQVKNHKPYIIANKPAPLVFMRHQTEEIVSRPIAYNPPELRTAPTTSSASAPESQIIDQIKKYIKELFTRHGVLNKSRVKELILKGKDANFPQATNAMLSTALQSSVAPFTPTSWILKTLDDPALDEFRLPVAELVAKMEPFKMSDLQTRINELGNPALLNIPAGVLSTIVSELAEYKGGERLWHVKSGSVMNH